MRFGVVRFPGSCDETDAVLACRRFGDAELLWHRDRDLRGADAVVYHRSESDRDADADRFEVALLDGLRATAVPVVGVELSEADPSQINFYEKAGLSTVDDVDQPAGKIAVVLTLTGVEGNYGFKNTADAPLPPARSRARGR